MSGPTVKLPCNIGDRAYWKSPFNRGLISGLVTAFTIDRHGIIIHTETAKREEKEIVRYEQNL